MSKCKKCGEKRDCKCITMRRSVPTRNIEPLGSRSNPYDYVIVGAGTAGSVLARLLTDNLTTSVLVLEAGEYHGDDPRIRNGFLFGDSNLAGDPRYSIPRFYEPGGISKGLEGLKAYSEHQLWGGGSAANGMSTVQGTRRLFDGWATVGGPQWGYDALLPPKRFLEHFFPNAVTPPNPIERGFTGPLNVTQDPPLPPNPIYADIATATQVPANYPDYNDSTYGEVGVTASQWFRAGGIRSDAQTAFLGPDVINPVTGLGVGGRRLQILSRATAVKIIIEGNTAVGMRYFIQNAPDDVRDVFAKKTILSAGSIASPQLLQLSGIGPEPLLNSRGIPVVLNNPHVGQHGQNHYFPTGLIERIPFGPPPGFEVRADQFFIDISGNNIVQANDMLRRAQVYMLPFNDGVPRAILTALGIQNVPAWSFIAFNMMPNNLAEVNIVSIDPLDDPEILMHYYEDVSVPGRKSDLERAIDMYRVFANISIQHTGQLPLYPPPSHYPVAEYGAFGGTAPDTSLLELDARDVTLIAAYHLSGTARMGDVVDGNLDVIGINGLSVADMSITPVIPDANTAYAAFLIGLVKAKIEGAAVPY